MELSADIAWALSWLVGAALLTRLALWWRYRPTELNDDQLGDLPRLAVVIPAFNEGAMVRQAIASALASGYPRDRLEVIVVDDGSTDDTGWHIDRAARLDDRVTAVHLPRNRGKRHALHTGFTRAVARGVEVVATLDSDSQLTEGSLQRLVAPLVQDAAVGGVAGKVVALNRSHNILTRMLGVRYILGFDFVRAYQSELRTVWCCPGALQAYRLALIAPFLDAWRDQTFLGAACTNGDDHAMTNLVLSLGADTVYQANAVVETVVPSTYSRLCRMYIRWGRSATREGLRALRFAPSRAARLGPLRGPLMLVDAILQPLTVLARAGGLAGACVLAIFNPSALAAGALGTTVFALGYCLVFLRSERSLETLFGVLYAWFAMLALPWVQPFATLTVRSNGWMTRA